MKRISLLVSSAFLFGGFDASASQRDLWRENVNPYLPPQQQVQNAVELVQDIFNIIDDHKTKRAQRKLLEEQKKLVKAQKQAIKNQNK